MTLPSCIIYSNLIYIKEHIEKYSRNGDNHNYLTRNRDDIQLPQQRLTYTRSINFGILLLNSLPTSLKDIPLGLFKKK